MASKKKKTKSKAPKPKSKKPSSGKARSKASTGVKSKKSAKSKKFLKVGTSKKKKEAYTLVTLHPKTRKVITPKRGQQVFFGWKSAQGKIYPIESMYSQAYYKTDADGIKAAFKAGSPEAYNVYQELTKDVSTVIDKEGQEVQETRTDKDGKEQKIFRWKLTGRNLRKAQRPAVRSIKEFLMPLGRAFHPHEPREIPKGNYIKVPVNFTNKKTEPFYVGRFEGDSIRDTLQRVLPDTSTSELMKKGIRSLIVSCLAKFHKPENPYLEDTEDGEEWERWANKVWPKTPIRSFSTSMSVPVLMDFASRVSTGFRKVFSAQGLRVTSLLTLEQAEKEQKQLDKTIFKLFDPWWPKVIQAPEAGVRYKLSAPGVGGKYVPANKYHPLRFEGGTKEALQKAGEKYSTIIELWITIKAN